MLFAAFLQSAKSLTEFAAPQRRKLFLNQEKNNVLFLI